MIVSHQSPVSNTQQTRAVSTRTNTRDVQPEKHARCPQRQTETKPVAKPLAKKVMRIFQTLKLLKSSAFHCDAPKKNSFLFKSVGKSWFSQNWIVWYGAFCKQTFHKLVGNNFLKGPFLQKENVILTSWADHAIWSIHSLRTWTRAMLTPTITHNVHKDRHTRAMFTPTDKHAQGQHQQSCETTDRHNLTIPKRLKIYL